MRRDEHTQVRFQEREKKKKTSEEKVMSNHLRSWHAIAGFTNFAESFKDL